jgi:hypothetical protein
VKRNVEKRQISLDAKQQFWWGFFGGFMVLLFKIWTFAKVSAPDMPYPNGSFRTLLLSGVWFVFPFVSGLVSRVFEPHSRLHAVIEGAAAPTLFLAIARDFPL